jgi:hypothetical protein
MDGWIGIIVAIVAKIRNGHSLDIRVSKMAGNQRIDKNGRVDHERRKISKQSSTSSPGTFTMASGPPSPIPPVGPSAATRTINTEQEDEENTSPFISQRYNAKRRSTHTLRRVQRVSRHAAEKTKQQLWDTNDASIGAAIQAVDQWEGLYNAARGLLVATVQSAKGLYDVTKAGAGSLEHGILVPVRDYLLLPAFGGVERAATETVRFLQSSQAQQLAENSLELAKQVPCVGENLLAPTMCFSVGFVQRTWQIAQYPIPSKQQVRHSVDFALNGTKWVLSKCGREILIYLKRADANITRTLMHTQWKVLGSGPYATLDKLNKREVIDHLCERYFSLQDAVVRYELAAHVRVHNRPLYHDLVLTGVLGVRGGELCKDDEWLSTCPAYRGLEAPFLISSPSTDVDIIPTMRTAEVVPLWFRLPYINGKRPARDVPWVCFRSNEQESLEQRYRQVLQDGQVGRHSEPVEEDSDPIRSRLNDIDNRTRQAVPGLEHHESLEEKATRYPTVAKWNVPNPEEDVLVDQKRHAVSFFVCCAKCRKPDTNKIPRMVQTLTGDLCRDCAKQAEEMPFVAALLSPPPVASIQRPTFWRFHGPGDEVRRAAWLYDTPRNGLQPFDEEAQAILEDAYLFLKWMSVRHEFDYEDSDDLDSALLTVEVPCPDGTARLVQFSSLTQATAIQKGLGAAVALFKRRVYRGAWLEKRNAHQNEEDISFEDTILQAVEDNGALGDTSVPDTSIRSVITPRDHESRLVVYSGKDDVAASMAVPPSRMDKEDMTKLLDAGKEGNTDHLVLIVHGIGEMLLSGDVLGLSLPNLSSIIDCCGHLRKNHAEVQDAHFSQMYPTADATSRSSTGRVEYLPVEWHEAFSILSLRRPTSSESARKPNVTLKDITLRTIPNMRDFANDTLMDVLYFMNPEHHDTIIDIVTNEMNIVVEMFRQLTGFDGRISVVGHSLGSIIAWDILGNQNIEVETIIEEPISSIPDVPSYGTIESAYGSSRSEDDNPELTQPELPPPVTSSYPQLEFNVDNFFLLGSPVAVFLMIRNQQQPLTADFFLRGCDRVFNIFHPYDPIAYRIEPCISPRNADFEPTIMKHWNGGFRVQYQTKRLWRKLVDTTFKTQQSVVEAFEESMAKLGLLDTSAGLPVDDEESSSEFDSDDNASRGNYIGCGQLNRGRRIDYMVQEHEVETASEYVSALGAHSSYWIERDLSLFFARQSKSIWHMLL